MMQRMVYSVMAAPYEAVFFGSWVAASLVRPVLLLTVLCLLYHPRATWRKFQLFTTTIQYLVFCNDKKWKAAPSVPTTTSSLADTTTRTSKTIIFVRHGESTWNDTFNKGDRSKFNFVINFVPNLLYSIFMEWWFWIRGAANESWFFDAPLSHKGRTQAEGVAAFLNQDTQYMTPKEQELHNKLKHTSKLVCSNLRRAIATMGIGFRSRLETDTMTILPCLQEISRNPDALSITEPYGTVVKAWTDPYYLEDLYKNHVDTKQHYGNKPVSSNGLKRMQEFTNLLFQMEEDECIVAGGHSLWFRSFFRTYLPEDCTHTAKTKKIVNGGVVGFTLTQYETKDKTFYQVDPTTITVLHGGF